MSVHLRHTYACADRKSNMQYMRALFVSEEPEKDAPEKMAGLLSDYKIQSERRKKGPRILGLTGSDVTKVYNSCDVTTLADSSSALGCLSQGPCPP